MHKLPNCCPECKGEVFSDEKNGEEVCITCGLVIDNVVTNEPTPFENENQHYPSHNLAIGRNLGTQINPRDLWTILQNRSSENIPFRYNMMQTMLLNNKGTNLTRMLVQGSHLCKAYGLGNDLTFSNYYGLQIRKLSNYVKKRYCNTIAKALFIIAWSQTYHKEERTKQMMIDQGITTAMLQKVIEYLSNEAVKERRPEATPKG